MAYYRINVYLNGVKKLELADHLNESLASILDKLKTNLQLDEDIFYRSYAYCSDDFILQGILNTKIDNLDIEFQSKMFEGCFEKGKKYKIFLSQITDCVSVILINDRIVPMYIEGIQKLIDWIYTFRLHIDKIYVNEKSISDVNLVQVKNALNDKLNYVYLKTK